ncbi:MAG: low molecular weight phosphotyrosine protein phosphatase [Bacteroidetes bacterium]|nr:MAG: low molecular weight phosphotyrosine protein phosphatase [Bacteroidota bacterium]
MNILFVCMGNVCRSPMAVGLLKKKFEENNIDGLVDSAGFESYTINEPPDKRAIKTAEKYGIEVSGRARIFVKDDFDKFDKIYVMDMQNYRDVKDLTRNKSDIKKIDYLLNVLHPGKNETVPDPYSQGEYNCHVIFEILDKATTKIAENIQAN